jgi:hypothetical protein
MFHLLTIVAVVVALAISAEPVQARVGGKMHYEDVSLGIITDKATPKLSDDTETGWWQRGR